jgi:RNA-binding protein 8A
LHEETQDDDIYEAFSDYGQIKNMHMNLDRRTGYLKGYAMIEYERLKEAEDAIENMNRKTILGKTISVDFAFKKPRSRVRG